MPQPPSPSHVTPLSQLPCPSHAIPCDTVPNCLIIYLVYVARALCTRTVTAVTAGLADGTAGGTAEASPAAGAGSVVAAAAAAVEEEHDTAAAGAEAGALAAGGAGVSAGSAAGAGGAGASAVVAEPGEGRTAGGVRHAAAAAAVEAGTVWALCMEASEQVVSFWLRFCGLDRIHWGGGSTFLPFTSMPMFYSVLVDLDTWRM